MREIRELASQIRDKRKIMLQEGGERRGVQKPRLPRGAKARSEKEFLDEMNGLGIEVDDKKQHFKRTKSRGRSLVKKVWGVAFYSTYPLLSLSQSFLSDFSLLLSRAREFLMAPKALILFCAICIASSFYFS